MRLVTAAGDYLSVDDERDLELMGLQGRGRYSALSLESNSPPIRLRSGRRGRLRRLPADDGLRCFAATGSSAAVAPEEVTTIVVLRHAPPAPWIPVDQRGKLVVAIGCPLGASNWIEALRPVKSSPDLSPTPWLTLFLPTRRRWIAQPIGHRYYWKSDHLAELGTTRRMTC